MKLYKKVFSVLTAGVTLATLPACSTNSRVNYTLTDTLTEEYNTPEYKTIEEIKNDILPISKSINEEYTIIEEKYEYSDDKKIEMLIQQAINKNGEKVTIETETQNFAESNQETFQGLKLAQHIYCRVYDNGNNKLLRSEEIRIYGDEEYNYTNVSVNLSPSRDKFTEYNIEFRKSRTNQISANYYYNGNSFDKTVIHQYFNGEGEYAIHKEIWNSEHNEWYSYQRKLYDTNEDKLLDNHVSFRIDNASQYLADVHNSESFSISINGETITNDNYNMTIRYHSEQEKPSIDTIYESDWTGTVNNILPNGIDSINENDVQYVKFTPYISEPDTLPEMPNLPEIPSEKLKELLLK